MTSEGAAPAAITARRGSDIDITPPVYPKVRHEDGRLWLVLEDGRDYEVPDDPIKVLGLLHHMAGKTWVTRRWMFHAIERIAAAREWRIPSI